MNESEIRKHINTIYDEEAELGTPLKDAHSKIMLSQMRLYTALSRSNNREKAESQGQIEAAAEALHSVKLIIEEIATKISTLEISMTVLKGLAKGQL